MALNLSWKKIASTSVPYSTSLQLSTSPSSEEILFGVLAFISTWISVFLSHLCAQYSTYFPETCWTFPLAPKVGLQVLSGFPRREICLQPPEIWAEQYFGQHSVCCGTHGSLGASSVISRIAIHIFICIIFSSFQLFDQNTLLSFLSKTVHCFYNAGPLLRICFASSVKPFHQPSLVHERICSTTWMGSSGNLAWNAVGTDWHFLCLLFSLAIFSTRWREWSSDI